MQDELSDNGLAQELIQEPAQEQPQVLSYGKAATPTAPASAQRKPLPPEWQRVLDKKYASNGLLYHPHLCENCGHHLFDDSVLLGVVRKKCPVCKFPNEQEFNRVGEEQLLEYMSTRTRTQEVVQGRDEPDKPTGATT